MEKLGIRRRSVSGPTPYLRKWLPKLCSEGWMLTGWIVDIGAGDGRNGGWVIESHPEVPLLLLDGMPDGKACASGKPPRCSPCRTAPRGSCFCNTC
jgi:hypothetical protein